MDKSKVEKVRKELRKRFPEIPFPKTSYLLLETHRSGSTLLSAQLQKDGYGYPIEGFNPNPNFRKRFDLMINTADPVAFICQTIQYQTKNDIMGMKFHFSHFQYFQEIARKILAFSELTFTDGEVTELFFPNTKYLFLQRKDKIRQAISLSKAMQTGIWNETADQDQEYKKFVLPALYDREHIECCFDMLLADDFAWKKFLETNNFNYSHIWFEDLILNYNKQMEQIYSYLGFKAKGDFSQLLRQQSNMESHKWEKRFNTETPWTNDDEYLDAAGRNDLDSMWAFRGHQITRVIENHRWKMMPATRYKSMRSLLFRFQRKFREVFSTKSTK